VAVLKILVTTHLIIQKRLALATSGGLLKLAL
jgi:hypothetical protein